jgi:hypothetical protein
MEINAIVIITEKMIKEFIQFALFRRKHSKVIWMLFRIFSPILLLVGTYIMLIRPFIPHEGASESPLVYLFWLGLYLTLYSYRTPKQGLENSKYMMGGIQHFVFFENEFHTDFHSEQITSSSNIKYCGLHSVYETKDYIYLFVSATKALVLDKNALPSGSIPELCSVLSKKVKKYVVR